MGCRQTATLDTTLQKICTIRYTRYLFVVALPLDEIPDMCAFHINPLSIVFSCMVKQKGISAQMTRFGGQHNDLSTSEQK